MCIILSRQANPGMLSPRHVNLKKIFARQTKPGEVFVIGFELRMDPDVLCSLILDSQNT